MSYIMLISGVHPKTKTKQLTQTEIETIYHNTANLINEYKFGDRICEYNSIFSGKTEAKNDFPKMNAQMIGKPCPICSTPIESVPCAGTKFYFCPSCQVVRK